MELIGKERRRASLDTSDATRIKSSQTRFSSSPANRYTYIYIYEYIHIYIYEYLCVIKHMHCVHMCMCMYLCIYIFKHIYIYIYIYIYTYILPGQPVYICINMCTNIYFTLTYNYINDYSYTKLFISLHKYDYMLKIERGFLQ
jgi:hypothetical protein